MKILQQPHHRSIRSFVRRTSRMTASQQRHLATLWPRYGLNVKDGMIDPWATFTTRLDDDHSNNTITSSDEPLPLILEIGFGMGDSLLQQVIHNQHNYYIGIEVHQPGVGKFLGELAENNIDNVRVYCADAVEVLQQCIPDNSLQRIQLFFPDPWPKKRHHKRRIISTEFLQLIAKKLLTQGVDASEINVAQCGNNELKAMKHRNQMNSNLLSKKTHGGGILHIATDWQNYAEYILKLLQEQTSYENLSHTSDFCHPPSYRFNTKFEKRGERLGYAIHDIIFRRI